MLAEKQLATAAKRAVCRRRFCCCSRRRGRWEATVLQRGDCTVLVIGDDSVAVSLSV